MNAKQKKELLQILEDACDYDSQLEYQSAPSGEWGEYNQAKIASDQDVQTITRILDVLNIEYNHILEKYYEMED